MQSWRRSRYFPVRAILLSAAVVACAGSAQDEQGTKSEEAAPPTDPAMEERLRALDERLRPLYEKMLRTRVENEVDYANDTPAEVEAKEDLIRRAGSDLYSASYADIVDYTPFALDYPWFLNEASSRLSGKVWRVGRDRDAKDLATILPGLAPGDLIVLEGEYELLRTTAGGNAFQVLEGVTIAGSGRGSTSLKMEVYQVNQIRLENLTIECQSGAFVHPQGNGRVHLRDCLVRGYNGGHGGSIGLDLRQGVALIEQSTFDGGPGRAAGRGGGEAISSRGDTWLFIRHTQFIDNDGIFDVGKLAVLDGCIASDNLTHARGVSVHSSTRLFQREADVPIDGYQPSIRDFTFAFDDLEAVKAAAGMASVVDEETARWISVRNLDRSLPYWIALIRHQNPEVRRIAAERITLLTGEQANPNTDGAVEGERLADLGALFRAEQEHTRLMNWYERNEAQLKWNPQEEKYVVDARPPVQLRTDGSGYESAQEVADAFVFAVTQENWQAAINCFTPAQREMLAGAAIRGMLEWGASSEAPERVIELLERHEVDLTGYKSLLTERATRGDAIGWNEDVMRIIARVPDQQGFLIDAIGLSSPIDAFPVSYPRFSGFSAIGEIYRATLRMGALTWSVDFSRFNDRWFIYNIRSDTGRPFILDFLRVLGGGAGAR